MNQLENKNKPYNPIYKRLIIAIAIVTLFLLVLHYGIIPGSAKLQSDYPNYYIASHMFLDNKDLSNIYDNREFKKEAWEYGIGNQIVSFVPQTPPALLLYLPFVKFDPLTSKCVFVIINVILLIISMFLLGKVFQLDLWLTALILLSFTIPLANNFLLGQPYIFMLTTLLIALYLWKTKRHFSAGLLIGFVSAIKPFSLFLVLPAVLNRRWNLLAGMITGFIIPVIVVFMLHPEIYHPFLKFVLPAMMNGDINNQYDISFRSYSVILRNLFIYDPFRNPDPFYNSPMLFYFLKIFIFLLVIHFFSVLHINSQKTYRISETDSASTFLIAGLLVAPITSSYQYVFLLPVVCVLVSFFKKEYRFLLVNFMVFFIFSSLLRIPFIELAYIILLIVLCYLALKVQMKKACFSRVVVWVIPICLISLFAGIILSSDKRHIDTATPFAKVKTSGFPAELATYDGKLCFSELSEYNYVINYNGEIISDNNADLLAPGFSNDDRKDIIYYLKSDNTLRTKLVSREISGEKMQNSERIRAELKNKEDIIDYHLRDGLALITDDNKTSRLVRGHSSYPLRNSISTFPALIWDLCLSDDRRLICWSQETESGNYDIYIGDLETGKSERLTFNKAKDYSPAFYPNKSLSGNIGNYPWIDSIVFISERNGGLNDGRFYTVKLPKWAMDIHDEHIRK
jgi:hypothetical protein